MRRSWVEIIALLFGCVLIASQAIAQDPRQNEPGKFDFYLLALSWSPSFCEEAGERPSAQQQCAPSGRISFVVHGLWPQYEKGFPEFCQNPPPRLDRGIVSSMLDLMPAPRLIFHEWDKHGVCSGLPARGYFETVRKARAAREDSGGIPRAEERARRHAGRGRGSVRQSQSRNEPRRDRGDLRRHAAQRGAHLPFARSEVSRLRRGRSPRLPAGQAGDAAGARRVTCLDRGARR